MKRLLAIFCALAATALLAGCGIAAAPENGSINSEELRKAQALVITDEGSEESREITDPDTIKAFVEELRLDEWELAELPEDAQPQRTISFYQAPTRTLLDDGGDMKHVGDLIIYQDTDCVTLSVSVLSANFQIPEEAADYLEGL